MFNKGQIQKHYNNNPKVFDYESINSTRKISKGRQNSNPKSPEKNSKFSKLQEINLQTDQVAQSMY